MRFALLGVLLAAAPSRPILAQPKPVVIYLHGRIVEEQGPTAVSPQFGPYGYRAIVDSLGASGFEVIGDLRPRGTDPTQYAKRVADQVDSLLRAGAAAARIAVIGFSKGGGIAMLAAQRLGRTDITFVFMASCGEQSDLVVAGRILSVFERSDSLAQSCTAVFERAKAGTIHVEREIQTGLGHGAFFQPRPEWLEPVRAWIRRQSLP